MRSSSLLALLLAAAGCKADPASAPGEASAPGREDAGVVARLCKAAPCSGRAARVEVWRTETGKIGRYAHHGDGSVCSHPPMLVFDASGKELGGIAFEPVVRGSEKHREIQARRESLLGGHELSEVLDCEGRVRRAPKK